MSKIFLTVDENHTQHSIGDLLTLMASNKNINFRNYDVGISYDIDTILFDNRDDVIDFFIKTGYTSYFRTEAVNEAIIAKGATQYNVIPIIHTYLNSLNIGNELVMVEPFFFARTYMQNYSDFIEDIFKPYLSNVKDFRIVTSNHIDSNVQATVMSKLNSINPNMRIIHLTSNDYHDRFIISKDNEKGILIGTSFNGLGNKLTLIDTLEESDTREILADLTANNLL